MKSISDTVGRYTRVSILLFFIATVVSAGTMTKTWEDHFTDVSYSNNDGTDSFASDWDEDDDDSASSGRIFIDDGRLRIEDLDDKYIERGIDLSDAKQVGTTVNLYLEWSHDEGSDEYPIVQLWNDDDGDWDTVAELNGDGGTVDYNLTTAQISQNSKIRIISDPDDTSWGESFMSSTVDKYSIDNLKFSAQFNDNDGDGVADIDDIDDDNDGIPDETENNNSKSLYECVGNSDPGLDGSYLDDIYWFDWGDGDFADGIDVGDKKSFTLPNGVVVTAEIVEATAWDNANETQTDTNKYKPVDMRAWNNGNYKQLYQYYNPDSDGDGDNTNDHEAFYNSDDAGIDINFTIKFTATTPDGKKLIPNIVAADAESTDQGSDKEHVYFNTDGEDWIGLDHIANDKEKMVMSGKDLNLSSDGASGEDGHYVGLSYEATNIKVNIRAASSKQGVAFGIWWKCGDSDQDGVKDSLDLDSDNDGIPDNVEAQTTSDYEAPSGSDSDGDGLDDSYDTDNGGTAVTLPDTDSDGTQDYLDTDSDNDFVSDCSEGFPVGTTGKTCPVDSDDTGTNGLVDWAEDVDDYSDPNGKVDAPQNDLQYESTLSENDYRLTDTDGDGILNKDDLDDDNDGILDAVEIQGGGKCKYGFYHVVDGQLKLIDTYGNQYIDIGKHNGAYNAMGYNEKDGYLYAVMRKSGTDANGYALERNDIVRIDTYTGELYYMTEYDPSGNHDGSFTGDIYDGILYMRNTDNLKEFTCYDIENNTVDNDCLTINDSFKPADFVIMESGSNIIFYGANGNDKNDGTDQKLYRLDFNSKDVSTVDFTMPSATSRGDGHAYIADLGSEVKLFIGNNGGGTYRIYDYDSSSVTAERVYDTDATNSNDGASCPHANQFPADTDGDGLPDMFDLDSDNDGIPDNIEAQKTGSTIAPSGVDSDGDGLDDAYDSNTSGAANSMGIIPADTDRDKKPDYTDEDSDNHGDNDCLEGFDSDNNSAGKDCSSGYIENHLGENGMVDWAEESDNWNDVNGSIDDIANPSSADLKNEGYTDYSELAYREWPCYTTMGKLEHLHWKVITFSCDTGSIGIEALLGKALGEYGDDKEWVMYEQPDGNYSGDPYHDESMRLMQPDDPVKLGKGYWIITDAGGDGKSKELWVDPEAGTIGWTPEEDASDYSVNDSDFDKVFHYRLPDSSSSYWEKVMVGNPFYKPFHLENLYYSHASSAYGATMDDNEVHIKKIVYVHDSPERGGYSPDSYTAKDPDTPGFDGTIDTAEGFWIKLIESDDEGTNELLFPKM